MLTNLDNFKLWSDAFFISIAVMGMSFALFEISLHLFGLKDRFDQYLFELAENHQGVATVILVTFFTTLILFIFFLCFLRFILAWWRRRKIANGLSQLFFAHPDLVYTLNNNKDMRRQLQELAPLLPAGIRVCLIRGTSTG